MAYTAGCNLIEFTTNRHALLDLLNNTFVVLCVFFVALCDIAIAQSFTENAQRKTEFIRKYIHRYSVNYETSFFFSVSLSNS